tara:strand:- start:299 stop:664 length:366 start_codon:yes stop_codon:yes gene_type:complete
MKQYLEWPLQENDITSELCEKCAICCHSTITLPWEVRALDWFDTVIETNELVEKVGHGTYQFTCGYLKDNQCSIYEDRPQLCRDYNCVTWAKCGKDLPSFNKVLKIAGKDLIDIEQWGLFR